MTHLRCPHCQRQIDLLAACDAADGREFFEAVMALPAPAIKPVLRYLALFSPPTRGLTWSRLGRLLRDLQEPLKRGELRRDGKLYTAPVDVWLRAMTHLVEDPPKTLTLPLRGHGYLLSIIAGQAERVAAATEQARIDSQRRRPAAPTTPAPDGPMPAPARDAALAALDGIKNRLRGGGP